MKAVIKGIQVEGTPEEIVELERRLSENKEIVASTVISAHSTKDVLENYAVIGSATNHSHEFYKENGIALFVKGEMVIGIHPDNF